MNRIALNCTYLLLLAACLGASGGYRMENQANRLHAEFAGGGPRVVHDENYFDLRLESYGFEGRRQAAAPAAVDVRGARVEYRRGALVEWYANEARGLEQGFTLSERPAGPARGPLTLALQVGGNLRPRLSGKDVVLERDGHAVLVYAGLRAWDAAGRELPAHMQVDGNRVLLCVEEAGAEYPVTIDPWIQQQKLAYQSSQGGIGAAVAVDGDTAVVGAPVNGGTAEVFVRHDSVLWTVQQLLSYGNSASNQFGAAVAVSGNTIMINDNSGGPGQTPEVAVFVRSGTVWTLVQGAATSDHATIGAIALDGDTAVFGSSSNNAAYVFVRSGATWVQQQKLVASDAGTNDQFGGSVSLDGDRVLIGAYGQSGNKGAAYTFTRSGTVWTQQQKLTASDGAANDYFGISVSLSGNWALIGAGGKTTRQGAVYAFNYGTTRNGLAWAQVQTLTAADGAANDFFGGAVALQADIAVIGASHKTVGGHANQGAAYVFNLLGVTWHPQTELTANDGVALDSLGVAVALSGDTALIGAPAFSPSVGAAYAFVLSSVPVPDLTVNAADSGGTSFTLAAPVSSLDLLTLTVSGSVATSGSVTSNAAGVSLGSGGCINQNGICAGALLLGNSTLGFHPLFPPTAAYGAGQSSPPTRLALRVPLESIFGPVSLPAGTTLFLKVADTNYSDNSGQFAVTTPRVLDIPATAISAAAAGGTTLTLNRSYGPNDLVFLTASGTVDTWAGGFRTNAAGIVTGPQNPNGGAHIGGCFSVTNFCQGALLMGAGGVLANVFPASAAFGDGAASPPQAISILTPLATLLGSSLSLPIGSTVSLSVNDAAGGYSDNSGSYALATPRILPIPAMTIQANDATGVGFTVVGDYGPNDVVALAANGIADLATGTYQANPAGIVTGPATTISGNHPGDCLLYSNLCAGGLLLSETALGDFAIFAANTPDGLGSATAPATVSDIRPLGAIFGEGATIADGDTLFVRLKDTGYGDNSGSYAIGAAPILATSVRVETNPAGLPLTVDGSSVNTPIYYDWTPGPNHILSAAAVTQNGAQYSFQSWSDGGAATHQVTSGTTAADYIANFATGYQLTVQVSPAGAGTATPATGYHSAGSVVPIAATANSGYQFANWTGNVTSASNASTTVTLTAAETVVANFSPLITIQTSPPGLQFTVDSGVLEQAPQSLALTAGTHTIAVTSPQSGPTGTRYLFSGWSDGGAQSHAITVGSSPATYTVTFTTQYQLTISASPAAGGSVTPASGTFYNSGTVTPISAAASAGYAFSGWSGSVASASSASTTVTMSAPETVVATFAAAGFTLAPNSVNWGAGYNTGAVTVTAPTPTSTWTAVSNASFLTITAGASGTGGGLVQYALAANNSTTARTGTLTIAGLTFTVTQAGFVTTGLGFFPVTPCRVVDTRTGQGKTGAFGPPSLAAQSSRDIPIAAGGCNIPATAQAFSLNITVAPAGPLTYLTIWPTGLTQPLVSTLNSLSGAIVANAAVVPAGSNGSVSVYVSNATDAIVDIDGYFAPPTSAALAFYPVTPCRVADTRQPAGPFGGPLLSAGTSRNFAVPSSACGIPTTAQAYSLNMTAVPTGPLTYLTTWPAGQPQPLVSTLNALQGQIVANAAIVPAGSGGAISVFASDPTHVVVDIDGYFAPPGGAGELYFYSSTPCRVLDTRNAAGPFGGPALTAGSPRAIGVLQSACSIPSAAKVYSLNMTVVPPGPLTYLTTWPGGQPQPLVSTLNALQGQIVANAAIVPAGGGGQIDVFVSEASHVIIDINGYFGQ